MNEFLKEHGKVEKLEMTVARLQKQIEAHVASLIVNANHGIS